MCKPCKINSKHVFFMLLKQSKTRGNNMRRAGMEAPSKTATIHRVAEAREVTALPRLATCGAKTTRGRTELQSQRRRGNMMALIRFTKTINRSGKR